MANRDPLPIVQLINSYVDWLTNEEKAGLLDDMCTLFGYEEFVPGLDGLVPNPVSKVAFINIHLTGHIRNIIKKARRQAALNAIVVEEPDI